MPGCVRPDSRRPAPKTSDKDRPGNTRSMGLGVTAEVWIPKTSSPRAVPAWRAEFKTRKFPMSVTRIRELAKQIAEINEGAELQGLRTKLQAARKANNATEVREVGAKINT